MVNALASHDESRRVQIWLEAPQWKSEPSLILLYHHSFYHLNRRIRTKEQILNLTGISLFNPRKIYMWATYEHSILFTAMLNRYIFCSFPPLKKTFIKDNNKNNERLIHINFLKEIVLNSDLIVFKRRCEVILTLS